MSDSTATAHPAGGSPKITKIQEAVIRIAGNSQDGIQAIGGFLARLAGRSEQEVMTFMTIPSTISGGPSIFQVRIGSGEVLRAGDEADMLVAFYQHSYEDHIGSLKKGGIVLYDSDHVQAKPEWQRDYRHVGVAISGLTVEAIGGTAKDKGKNVFVLGLIAKMFDLNVPKLEQLIRERFTGKDDSIAKNALMAMLSSLPVNRSRISCSSLGTFRSNIFAIKPRTKTFLPLSLAVPPMASTVSPEMATP